MHYWGDNDFGPSFANVRVYIYSTLVFEIAEVELVKNDMWDVCRIEWPAGNVKAVVADGGGHKITADYENPMFVQ